MKTISTTFKILFIFLLTVNFAQAQVPPNNECSGAIDLSSFLGQAIDQVQVTSLYDNTEATSEASDPDTGWECFGEPNFDPDVPLVENTLWFTFQGDGNAYFFETVECSATNYIDDGDTQIALYEGSCGALTPIGCNDDGPSTNGVVFPAGITFVTTPGVTYYMMIDGFNFQGSLSRGEFCIEITRKPIIGCNEMSPGTISEYNENVCFGDATFFAIENVQFPNSEEEIIGLVWLVSSQPLENASSPADDPNFIGSFPIFNVINAPGLVNDGSPLAAGNTYFFTPIMIANAVDTSGNFTFTGLDMAQGCSVLGDAYSVTFIDSAFTIDATVTDAMDGAGGAITLDIGGGTGTYDVSWDSGQMGTSISDLGPGDYTATISDPSGCIPDEVVTYTVDDIVATIDLELDQKIELRPNPVSEQQQVQLNFNLVAPRDITVQLFNTTGQLIKMQALNNVSTEQLSIDMEGIGKGLYFIHITTNEQEFTTKKLVVK